MNTQKFRLTPWQLGTIVAVIVVWSGSMVAYVHAQFQAIHDERSTLAERVTRNEVGNVYQEKMLTRIDHNVDDLIKNVAETNRILGIHRHAAKD